MPPDLRLGVDVGSTNTDAVVVDDASRVLAKAKVPTSPDVTDGIDRAIAGVIRRLDAPTSRVTHVMIGTTHMTSALVTRRGLRRVAVVRIGAPATTSVPPLAAWPEELRAAVSAGEAVVPGGIESDGSEISPFDGDAVARFLEPLAGRVEGVAITSVFASVSDRHEQAAARVARTVLGDVDVSMSHEISSIGLIERENATVLNAALADVADGVARSLDSALLRHGIVAARYLAQNDGLLMSMDYALRFPVLTIGCGPANSMRGAMHLSEYDDAIIADVGGTSTEVGALVNGFPSTSSDVIGIAGVRTNFRMPDTVTLRVGGGTVVARDGDAVRLGPASVGYRLVDDALSYGGTVCTLTDAAAGCGRVALPDATRTVARSALLTDALRHADALLADAVDRAKVARGDRPLVVVGGASFLVPESLPGVADIRRPEHADVANAIGAAMGPVGGSVDRIVRYGAGGRARALDEIGAAACDQAIRAGADPPNTVVVETEEVPLAYLTDPAVHVRVRAAGPLATA